SQAEDGIRDFHVTGVQTCALPISLTKHLHKPQTTRCLHLKIFLLQLRLRTIRAKCYNTVLTQSKCYSQKQLMLQTVMSHLFIKRSEERRVGKEGREMRQQNIGSVK